MPWGEPPPAQQDFSGVVQSGPAKLSPFPLSPPQAKPRLFKEIEKGVHEKFFGIGCLAAGYLLPVPHGGEEEVLDKPGAM